MAVVVLSSIVTAEVGVVGVGEGTAVTVTVTITTSSCARGELERGASSDARVCVGVSGTVVFGVATSAAWYCNSLLKDPTTIAVTMPPRANSAIAEIHRIWSLDSCLRLWVARCFSSTTAVLC